MGPVSDEFEDALEAAFGERASQFSGELKKTLQRLYQTGVSSGKMQERESTPFQAKDAKVSECGRYLCFPVPKSPLDLVADTDTPVMTSFNPGPHFSDMDGDIIEQILKTAEKFKREMPLACDIVPPPGIRIKDPDLPSADPWANPFMNMSLRFSDSNSFRSELYGTWVDED